MLRSPRLVPIAALVALVALAGCTSAGASDSDKGQATESHLTKILKSKTVTIGVPSGGLPWGNLTKSGDREGFDPTVAKALGEALGAKVVFVNSVDQNRIPLIQTHKVDAIISSFTATNERARTVAFSQPYAADYVSLLVAKNSPIKTFSDLAGKKVAVVRSTTGESVLAKEFPEAKPVVFSQFVDGVEALKAGKVDAYIATKILNSSYVEKDPDKLRPLDGPVLLPSLMGIGVEQGDQLWLNFINTFVNNWVHNGQGDEAYQKWFHTSMPDFLK